MDKEPAPKSYIASRGYHQARWTKSRFAVMGVGCGKESAASLRFCRHCGTQLDRVCPVCGFEGPAEAKFCGGCGAQLDALRAEESQGERRQITVLFCDIVGATVLSQLLDPEDLGELIGAYQSICGDAATAHEGYIAQCLGDGVVMYFGYPCSHEDQAQRAVRCGLDILRGVRTLRDSGRLPAGAAFHVRLGAHTGRVVIGLVGAGHRKDRLALGDVPNIAARIQARADPGTFVVSEVTWKIVEGYFTGKCFGHWRLKGVSQRMMLWLVIGESTSKERVDVVGRLTTFIGREGERAALEQTWNDSRAGHSRFILLRGDPGMGKSRLARLFSEQVQFQAVNLVRIRSTPYDTNSPFHPVIELIEHKFELSCAQTSSERWKRLEEGLANLELANPDMIVLLGCLLSIPVNNRSTSPTLSPARTRTRTLHALVEFMTAIAKTGPALLLVEDLHWVDTSTLEFLELLVKTAPDAPLMGIFTARCELDADWAAAPALRVLELSRLRRAEVESIARGVALGKALPSEVVRQIVVRSDGVPLFVEELTRSILSSGALREKAVSWEAIGDVAVEIPVTMDASLTSRIDCLGLSKPTAQLAATIGRRFNFELLREVSERDEATLRQDLQRMVRAGLAWSAQDEAETFVFKHALVRDAAYDSLLRSTRQHYHSRIAAVLRVRFTDPASARPDLIAHHLTNAGEYARAVDFWKAAAGQALARTDTCEAAEHLQRAIDCLKHLPPTSQRAEGELEIQMRLAPLLMTVYGWGATQVQHACERALVLAQDLGRPDRTYRPLWGLWTVRFLRGEMAAALEAAGPVLQAARASGDPMIEITGRHAISYSLVFRGQVEGALKEAEAGLALYEFEREKVLAGTFALSSSVCLHASKGHALWMLGRVVEAEHEWNQMLQLARDLAHPPSFAAALAFTLHGGGFQYGYLGEMDRLVDIADELLVRSREDDLFLWHAVAATYQGIIAEAMGKGERARKQMLEGLDLFAQTKSRLTLVMMNILCAEALYRLEDDDEAFRRLEVAEAEMHTRQEALLGPDIWRVRGRLLGRQGKRAAAEISYRQAIQRAHAQYALSLELRAALDLYELRADDHGADEARDLLAGVLARFTQGLNRPEPARAGDIIRSPRRCENGDDIAIRSAGSL